MKSQLSTVKDDIRKEFDTKLDTIFELFRSHMDPRPQPPSLKVPRDTKGNGTGNAESPAHKKPDTKSTPMYDSRLLAMQENQHFMERMHARNFLLHRFNAVAGYTDESGYNHTMPYGSMNLPQARADHSENVG